MTRYISPLVAGFLGSIPPGFFICRGGQRIRSSRFGQPRDALPRRCLETCAAHSCEQARKRSLGNRASSVRCGGPLSRTRCSPRRGVLDTVFRQDDDVPQSFSLGAVMDVASWLRSLGLEQYEAAFRAPRGSSERLNVPRRVAKLSFKARPHMRRHARGYALATRGQDTRALEAYLDHRNIQHTVRWGAIANAVQEFLARVRGSACCLEASSYGRVSMLKDKTFTYRGHTFQVRANLLEKGWAVQVYER